MRITTFLNHETLMNQVTLLRDALRPHLSWIIHEGSRVANQEIISREGKDRRVKLSTARAEISKN
jgi:hypothetical protein